MVTGEPTTYGLGDIVVYREADQSDIINAFGTINDIIDLGGGQFQVEALLTTSVINAFYDNVLVEVGPDITLAKSVLNDWSPRVSVADGVQPPSRCRRPNRANFQHLRSAHAGR